MMMKLIMMGEKVVKNDDDHDSGGDGDIAGGYGVNSDGADHRDDHDIRYDDEDEHCTFTRL